MKPSENETKVSPTGGISAEDVVSDITERKRAEDALHESQALLTAIVDSTSDLIWSVDPQNFGLLTFNRSISDHFFRQRGVRLQTGMLPKDIVPTAEFIGTWEGFYRRVLAGGTFTTEHVTHTGSSVLQLTFNLLKRDDKVFGISVFGKDVTERRRAEEALHKSDERFRLFMDNSPAVAWMKDDAGRYVYLNETYQKRLGVRLEDWKGKADSDVYPPAIAEQFRRNDQAAIAAGHAIEVSEESLGPDGKQSFWLVYKFPFHDASGQVLVAGIGLDITERKRAEQQTRRFEALLSQSRDIILFIRHADGRIVGANDAATRAYGYNREELLELSIYDLCVTDRGEMTRAQMDRAGADGVLFEAEHKRKDGSIFPVEVSSQGSSIDGTLTLLSVIRDITERKQAEEALRASEERFRALITDAPVAIGVGRNGITRYVNTAYVQMFGFQNPEEVFGCPILDQHAPQCHEQIKNILRTRQQGLPTPNEYESIGRRRDGSIFPMHVAVSQVELADGPVSLGFLTDITERKQARSCGAKTKSASAPPSRTPE